MFASTSYSFLPPTTPPPPFSVYDSYEHFEDSQSDDVPFYAGSQYEEDNEPVDNLTCQPYFAPPRPSAASAAFDLPTMSIHSPLRGPSAHQRDVKSALDITSPVDLTGNFGEFASRGKMDMGMAVEGTVASQAGIQTPLGQYAAQMVVWLWHGTHAQPPAPASANSSPLVNSPNPFEPSQSTVPINPLQVAPSPEFAAFVERLLRITMVSHSVTLIALLYIYRLKMKNNIHGDPGSEQRPFVVSLILGNKYLDDNTYTNKTWADLAGLQLDELNRMEAEFLKGLDFSLGVDRSDYQHWRNLLDGFIFARQRESVQAAQAAARHHRPSYGQLYTPLAVTAPPMISESSFIRARSASPTKVLSPTFASAAQSYGYPSPAHRKRSAMDAFSRDAPSSSAVYEQMRLPARKAHFGSIDLSSTKSRQTSPSGLARSSSLNRRIARLPGEGGRRGSMGHVYGLLTPDTADLRHAAALHWQQEHEVHRQQWDGCSALSAAYQRPAQTITVPPEHLMFYQLAADAHPGYDGAPRKAILHYQQRPSATQYNHPPPPAAPAPVVFNSAYLAEDRIPHSDYSMAAQPYGYVVPQPAQFANAGPPGYAYDPLQHHSQPTPPYHVGLGIAGFGGQSGQWGEDSSKFNHPTMPYPLVDPRLQEYRTRSQWSSPIQSNANPHVWQRQWTTGREA